MKYGSRKFIVTLVCIGATVGLALVGKMTGEVANVLTGAIIAYNAANAAVGWKNGNPS